MKWTFLQDRVTKFHERRAEQFSLVPPFCRKSVKNSLEGYIRSGPWAGWRRATGVRARIWLAVLGANGLSSVLKRYCPVHDSVVPSQARLSATVQDATQRELMAASANGVMCLPTSRTLTRHSEFTSTEPTAWNCCLAVQGMTPAFTTVLTGLM